MLVLSDPQAVQSHARQWKQEQRIALVPTMGNLHEGHLSLVRKAKQLAEKCVVSIFVNPIQFGPNEDLDDYPRTLAADQAALRELEVDLLFAPAQKDLYPDGFQTGVQVGSLAGHLCGQSRPGHFSGVATVCLKLFEIAQPNFAVFGRKDFQQLRVIEQMVQDFNLPLEIVPGNIVREQDGLAMSSRNRYLDSKERELARRIPTATGTLASHRRDATVGELCREVEQILGEGVAVEYLEIASEEDLIPQPDSVPVESISSPHFFLAVKIGSTRLIDNLPLHS